MQLQTSETWLTLIHSAAVPSAEEIVAHLNRVNDDHVSYSLKDVQAHAGNWESFSVTCSKNQNVSTLLKFDFENEALQCFLQTLVDFLASRTDEPPDFLLPLLNSTRFAVRIDHSDPNPLSLSHDCAYVTHCFLCHFGQSNTGDGFWYMNHDDQTFFGDETSAYLEFAGTIPWQGAG